MARLVLILASHKSIVLWVLVQLLQRSQSGHSCHVLVWDTGAYRVSFRIHLLTTP